MKSPAKVVLSLAAACLLRTSTLAGAPDGPAKPVVLAGDAIQPQLAADEAGGFYAVFIQDGNIAVSVSTDGGKTFSAPVVAIDVKGEARGGAQRGPRIGVDAKKNIVVTCPVTFDAEEQKQKYPTAELYIVRSTDGGKSWSKPLQVNEVAKKAPEALHWLAVAPSGEAHVAWLDLRSRLVGGQDIYHAVFADGKVGKNTRVETEVCECCAPGLAVGAHGEVVLAWREGGKGKPSRELFAAVSRDGGKSFGAPSRLNSEKSNLPGCPMSAPAVAVSRDGKKTVTAWMDQRTRKNEMDVFWSIASGSSFEKDERVHAEAGGEQNHPSVVFDSSGAAWVAWEDARSGKKTIWTRSSRPGAREARVSDEAAGAASYPSLAAGGAAIGVVYETAKGGEESVVFAIVSPAARAAD